MTGQQELHPACKNLAQIIPERRFISFIIFTGWMDALCNIKPTELKH